MKKINGRVITSNQRNYGAVILLPINYSPNSKHSLFWCQGGWNFGLDGMLALKLLTTFFCRGPIAPCCVVTAPTPSPLPGDSVAEPYVRPWPE